ncbi:MAG TPA: SURF1 family protein [Candidatus Nanopelagicales bacterium]
MSSPRPPSSASWLGALRDRRVWGLGFLVIFLVPAFLLLSRWQLHRLDEQRVADSLVNTHIAMAPVPVADVMRAGADPDTVGDSQQWRRVTATGRYDVADQQLVRQRTLNGGNGYWVMTPLVTTDGSVLAVARGWVAAGADAISSPTVPAPPSGVVTVLGRIRISEDAPPRPSDLPAGQVTDLDVRAVTAQGPVYPGYVELISSDPPETGSPAVVPLPIDIQLDASDHLSYAVQWICFAVIAIGGFVVILRGEARRREEDAELAESPTEVATS